MRHSPPGSATRDSSRVDPALPLDPCAASFGEPAPSSADPAAAARLSWFFEHCRRRFYVEAGSEIVRRVALAHPGALTGLETGRNGSFRELSELRSVMTSFFRIARPSYPDSPDGVEMVRYVRFAPIVYAQLASARSADQYQSRFVSPAFLRLTAAAVRLLLELSPSDLGEPAVVSGLEAETRSLLGADGVPATAAGPGGDPAAGHFARHTLPGRLAALTRQYDRLATDFEDLRVSAREDALRRSEAHAVEVRALEAEVAGLRSRLAAAAGLEARLKAAVSRAEAAEQALAAARVSS